MWRTYVSALVAERDQLKGALASTKQELDEVRSILRELKAAVLARQNAETELRSLYREREIQRAQAVQRDDNDLLN
jgi:hypothetical protein